MSKYRWVTMCAFSMVSMFAVGAHANVIFIASKTLPALRSDIAEPWTSTFQLNQGIQENQFTLAEFILPTTTSLDTYLITQNNVEQFGETWENVLAWTDGLVRFPHWTHRVVNWTHNGQVDGNPGQSVAPEMLEPFAGPQKQIGSFTPIEFKIEIGYTPPVNLSPALSQLRWTITGEGVVVPEPTSIAMGGIGAALIGLINCASIRRRAQ